MKTFAVVAALLLAACESRVDTPTADDRKLVLRPESLKTGKPIDASAVHCDVMPPLLAYHRVKCVYFDSSVERDYLESDAEDGFGAIKDAWTMLHLRPADELLSLGEHHYAAYMMDGDTPRGNGFIVRQGTSFCACSSAAASSMIRTPCARCSSRWLTKPRVRIEHDEETAHLRVRVRGTDALRGHRRLRVHHLHLRQEHTRSGEQAGAD